MNWNEKFSHKIGFTKVLDLDKTMTENISKADKNSVNKTDINCGTLQLQLKKRYYPDPALFVYSLINFCPVL